MEPDELQRFLESLDSAHFVRYCEELNLVVTWNGSCTFNMYIATTGNCCDMFMTKDAPTNSYRASIEIDEHIAMILNEEQEDEETAHEEQEDEETAHDNCSKYEECSVCPHYPCTTLTKLTKKSSTYWVAKQPRKNQ